MRFIHSHKGFSLLEFIISVGILAIILVAVGSLFTWTNISYSTQNELINLQENARSTLDFIVRLLRNGVSSTVVITGTSPNNTLSLSEVEDFSRSTGGNSSTVLNDSAKSWVVNNWQNFYVIINSGTGSGQSAKQIASNTATQLTISSASPWTTVPDATSDYRILSTHSFSLSGNTLQYTKNGTASTLSDNITGLSALPEPFSGTKVDLTLSAQTANVRRDTGQRGSVTISSSVNLKN